MGERGVYYPVIYKSVTTSSVSGGSTSELDAIQVPRGWVAEVFDIRPIPPVDPDTGTVTDWDYLTVAIDGSEIGTIRMAPVQAPPKFPGYPKPNLEFTVGPYVVTASIGPAALWKFYVPDLRLEFATALKLKSMQKMTIKIRASSGTDISYTTGAVIGYALCKEEFIPKALGAEGEETPAFDLRVDLRRPEHADWTTVFEKRVEVNLNNWTGLPGGLDQGSPSIMPFVVVAKNANATTPYREYQLDEDNVVFKETALYRDYQDATEALLLEKVGVVPATNLNYTKFTFMGLMYEPSHETKPLPDYNDLPPPMYYNANIEMKNPGPADIPDTYGLILNTKGGVAIVDSGTAVSANAVKILAYGKFFNW